MIYSVMKARVAIFELLNLKSEDRVEDLSNISFLFFIPDRLIEMISNLLFICVCTNSPGLTIDDWLYDKSFFISFLEVLVLLGYIIFFFLDVFQFI